MIRVFIGLSLSVFSIEVVFAQSANIHTQDWEKHLKISSKQKSVNITVSIKNNRVDISQVVENIEIFLDKSSYSNFTGIQDILLSMREPLLRLCENASNNTNKSFCLNNLNKDLVSAEEHLINTQAEQIFFSNRSTPPYPECNHASAFRQVNEMFVCLNFNNFCNIRGKPCLVSTLLGFDPETMGLSESLRRQSQSTLQIINKVKKLNPTCLKTVTDHLKSEHEIFKKYRRKICKKANTQKDREFCLKLQEHDKILDDRIISLTNSLPPNMVYRVCHDYRYREIREVNVDGVLSPDDTYLVQRNFDGNYTIPLAMEFTADNRYDGPVPEEQVHNHYLRKVKKCITEKANPYLIGPNGKRLNIEIQDAKNSKCIPKHSILITAAEERSLDDRYAADIECGTIVHEVLHNLGLVDEYKYPSYNCRVIQRNSIMSTHWERYCKISSNSNDDGCQSYPSCRSRRTYRSPRQRSRRGIVRRKINCQASLLDPAHFNAILYGDCRKREDVSLFRRCSYISQTNHCNNCSTHNYFCERKQECDSQNVLNRKRAKPIRRIGRGGSRRRGIR